MILIFLLAIFFQQPDHSPKPCRVTEVVVEGVRSDCYGWQPARDEKIFAPAAVNAQLRVGDTFYFVWTETRWVAEIRFRQGLSEPVVFDVVVVQFTEKQVNLAWECPDRAGELCSEIIPRSEWARGSYRYWPKQVKPGQLLKAMFFVGNLKSIPGCAERIEDAKTDYRQGLELRPPVNSLIPGDCSRPTSPFIRNLLEKTALKQ